MVTSVTTTTTTTTMRRNTADVDVGSCEPRSALTGSSSSSPPAPFIPPSPNTVRDLLNGKIQPADVQRRREKEAAAAAAAGDGGWRDGTVPPPPSAVLGGGFFDDAERRQGEEVRRRGDGDSDDVRAGPAAPAAQRWGAKKEKGEDGGEEEEAEETLEVVKTPTVASIIAGRNLRTPTSARDLMAVMTPATATSTASDLASNPLANLASPPLTAGQVASPFTPEPELGVPPGETLYPSPSGGFVPPPEDWTLAPAPKGNGSKKATGADSPVDPPNAETTKGEPSVTPRPSVADLHASSSSSSSSRELATCSPRDSQGGQLGGRSSSLSSSTSSLRNNDSGRSSRPPSGTHSRRSSNPPSRPPSVPLDAAMLRQPSQLFQSSTSTSTSTSNSRRTSTIFPSSSSGATGSGAAGTSAAPNSAGSRPRSRSSVDQWAPGHSRRSSKVGTALSASQQLGTSVSSQYSFASSASSRRASSHHRRRSSVLRDPPQLPPVKVRDFAFPEDDPRHTGTRDPSLSQGGVIGFGGYYGGMMGRWSEGDLHDPEGGHSEHDWGIDDDDDDDDDGQGYDDDAGFHRPSVGGDASLVGQGQGRGQEESLSYVPGTYIAIYAFQAEAETELSLEEGEQIRVVGAIDGGWFIAEKSVPQPRLSEAKEGERGGDGEVRGDSTTRTRTGLVPEAYVDLVSAEEEQ